MTHRSIPRPFRRGALFATLGALVLLANPGTASATKSNPGAAQALSPDNATSLAPHGIQLAKNPCNPCGAKNPCNPGQGKNPCNPCGAKNPCNPCQGKNPCNPCQGKNPCNPCGAKNPCNPCQGKNPCNPCGAKNPCNPCAGNHIDPARFTQPAAAKLSGGNRRELIAQGEKLWNDRMLGKSGLACANCHIEKYGQMNPSFAKPYPHRVAMPHDRAGVQQVSAAEMVQFCMVAPMMADPFDWNSPNLAALTAYVETLQAGYHPIHGAAMNPCNPCGGKNPCSPH